MNMVRYSVDLAAAKAQNREERTRLHNFGASVEVQEANVVSPPQSHGSMS